MKEKHLSLGTQNILRLIIRFSVPSILGMSLTALYNVVDRIFVGRGVGTDALAGIVINFPVMMIILGFSLLVAVGTASMVSIKLGEKKKQEAEAVIGNSFTLAVSIGIILTAVCVLFMEPILILFGARGATLRYAKEFLGIAQFSIVFQMIGFVLNGAIRAQGNALMGLLTLLIGFVVNIILNPVFIFILHLGVRGSSLATFISQGITAAWTVMYFLRRKSFLRLKLTNLKPRPGIIIEILRIGVSPFLAQNLISVTLIIANSAFNTYGNKAGLVTIGVITVIIMLFTQVITGIQRGIQPIISYNHGAQNSARVRRTTLSAIVIATGICAVAFIPLMLFSDKIIAIFAENGVFLSTFGVSGVRCALLSLPLLGVIIIGSGYFMAIAKYKEAMLLIMIRQVLMIVLLLVLPGIFGFYGAAAALPVADAAAALITFFMLAGESVYLKRKAIVPA